MLRMSRSRRSIFPALVALLPLACASPEAEPSASATAAVDPSAAERTTAPTAPDTLPVASMFPLGRKAPNNQHVGDVWLTVLARATDTFPYNMVVANSAPGARLNWHSHPGGQRLVVTEGVGYYQERGQPGRVMRPGDVIECAPDVEHWHAASPDKGVVYLALYAGGPTV